MESNNMESRCVTCLQVMIYFVIGMWKVLRDENNI